MINSPEKLRKFMNKHSLTNGDIATILGYKTYRYNESPTVYRMLAGDYRWDVKGHWVDVVLSKWVKNNKK